MQTLKIFSKLFKTIFSPSNDTLKIFFMFFKITQNTFSSSCSKQICSCSTSDTFHRESFSWDHFVVRVFLDERNCRKCRKNIHSMIFTFQHACLRLNIRKFPKYPMSNTTTKLLIKQWKAHNFLILAKIVYNSLSDGLELNEKLSCGEREKLSGKTRGTLSPFTRSLKGLRCVWQYDGRCILKSNQKEIRKSGVEFDKKERNYPTYIFNL